MEPRIIAHLDMDAFFAAVEEREKPYLRGLPVVVGADPEGGAGRGVVSTANYTARVYGIHSAMPISKAWQLSEMAREKGKQACAFIVPRHGKYSVVSSEVFSIVRTYAHAIEQTSVDEAYLDLSGYGTFGKAEAAARALKRDIKKQTKLTASIGLAPNKLLAKIASDAQKPDGLTVVLPDSMDTFLEPLPLRSIPGIGPKATRRLAARGIHTVQDAKVLSWEELEHLFGKWGFGMYERLRGIDERPVEAQSSTRKSIGKHYTFAEDTLDMEAVLAVLRKQAQRIIEHTHQRGFRGFRTTVLTVRWSDFTTTTRSLTVPDVLSSKEALEMKALKLVLPFFDRRENPRRLKFRLIGLRIEKLC